MDPVDGTPLMPSNAVFLAGNREDDRSRFAWLTALFAAAVAAVLLVALAVPARADVTPTLTSTYANTNAGASSDVTMATTFSTNPTGDDLKRLAFDLPAGMIGNPNAITSANRCGVDYTDTPPAPRYSGCPASSDVGNISVNVSSICTNSPITVSGSMYLLRNRPTANPEVPTRLGIHVSGTCWVLLIPLAVNMDFTAEIRLRPDDTGLRIKMIEDISRDDPIIGAAIKINNIRQTISGLVGGQPFLQNPTRCDAWVSKAYARAYDSYGNVDADIDSTIPGNDHKVSTSTLAAPGCGSLPAFNPGFTLTQTSTQAGQPTGITATLTNTIANPQPAHVKRVDMQFPLGYQINPAIANQMLDIAAACSDAQFNEANPDAAPTCPASSEVGSVSITTPLISGAVTGKVYMGQPLDAGNNRYRLMVYAANGAAVKFQARAKVAANGQVTVEFGNAADTGKYLPQFPWTQFQLVFYSGNRAMMSNSQVCGSDNASVAITPWTSPNQAAVNFTPSLTVTAGPNAAGCNFDAFAPTFTANLSDTGAGKHPNLSLTVTRGDRQDNLNAMTFRLPTGFGAAITAAASCPTATATAGACTATSQVGTIAVQVGTGPETVTLNGTVHLTDPGAGDIGKLAIQVPAVVGPFDLGVTVIWANTVVNSSTSFGLDSVTASMPQMIQGIPVRYRSVALNLNGIIGTGDSAKPFLLNPSVRGTLAFQATIASVNESPAAGVSTSVLNDTDQSTTGCPQTFNPSIVVTPTSTETVKPTGLTVTINVPQTTTGVTTSTIQQSTVKRVLMTMPPGMEINPAFNNGLTACSTADIDAGGARPARQVRRSAPSA